MMIMNVNLLVSVLCLVGEGKEQQLINLIQGLVWMVLNILVHPALHLSLHSTTFWSLLLFEMDSL